MKRILLLSVLFLGAALGDAMAQCASRGATRVFNIQAALEDKFVCAAREGGNNDKWSEEHGLLSGGGILTEYAKGPLNPVDPRKAVGTWSVAANSTANATVSYNYGDSGSPYTWSLFFIGTNSYLFCDALGNTVIATANITPLSTLNPANPCPLRQ